MRLFIPNQTNEKQTNQDDAEEIENENEEEKSEDKNKNEKTSAQTIKEELSRLSNTGSLGEGNCSYSRSNNDHT